VIDGGTIVLDGSLLTFPIQLPCLVSTSDAQSHVGPSVPLGVTVIATPPVVGDPQSVGDWLVGAKHQTFAVLLDVIGVLTVL
jgi:hypothetical protein